jgi:hypothetical protein
MSGIIVTPLHVDRRRHDEVLRLMIARRLLEA